MAPILLVLTLAAVGPSATAPTGAPATSAEDRRSVSVSVAEGSLPPGHERKRVEITTDNVDLAGAGWLEFTADAAPVIAAMTGAPFTWGQTSWGEGEITFNRAGRAIACIPGSQGIEARAEEVLCAQIEARARFHRNIGFDLPYDVGRLGFTMRVRQVMSPRRPIVFLPPGKGTELTLVTTGKFGAAGCSFLSNPFSAADTEAVCKAWIAAGRPGLGAKRQPAQRKVREPASARKPVRAPARTSGRTPVRAPSRGDMVQVTLKVNPNARNVLVEEKLLWKNVDLIYPSVPFAERIPTGTGNGSLKSSITSEDYPRQALIEEIGGKVSALVGFVREGFPISCRPVISSGTAYLDNATCEIAMRRLRFEFSPRAAPFTGAHYYVAEIRWVIPLDTDE